MITGMPAQLRGITNILHDHIPYFFVAIWEQLHLQTALFAHAIIPSKAA